MDIELLKTFLEVKRLRSFKQASEVLHVTQAAVSQRVKLLESQLDTAIFHREKNNIYLTDAGEQLVPYAESIVSAWVQARQEISLFPPQTEQLFTIAAQSNIWDLHATSYLSGIYIQFPELAIKTETHRDDVLVKKLINKTIDLAFLFQQPDLAELQSLSLQPIEIALQSNFTNDVESARVAPHVYVDWGRDVEQIYTKQLNVSSRPIAYTDHYPIAIHYLLDNKGSAFLPLVESQALEGFERVAGVNSAVRQLYAVWNKNSVNADISERLATSLLLEV